jgi:high-affinity iron transporter
LAFRDTFLDISLVALRESLEALLILGILLGVATKLGQPQARRPMLWGALAGLGVSIVAGILAGGVASRLYERNAEAFEGFASLLAVAILTYMIVWMYRHTQGMMGLLTSKTRDALSLGKPGVLFGLAFVAVVREGIETVLFTATKFEPNGTLPTLVALAAGIAVSACIAFLVFAGFLRLSIERFMLGTGLLLVLIGGGLLAYGAHELTEAGYLPETPRAYNLGSVLPSHGILGSLLSGLLVYRPHPSWLEVALWAAYIGGMGAWVVRRLRKHPKAAPPPESTPEVT